MASANAVSVISSCAIAVMSGANLLLGLLTWRLVTVGWKLKA